jgi:hypothetical protein
MKKSPHKLLTFHTSQQDIAILSVYLLGGSNKSIDTEDIAVKCHKLAPTLFSWKKYPNQVNIEIVRVVLSNCKKKQNGSLLIGSGREGWRLSTKGVEWISTRGKALLSKKKFKVDANRITAGSIDTVRKKREKMRLLSTPAWKSWTKCKSIYEKDAKNLFRIDEYTTDKMKEIKIVRMKTLFKDDKEISPFINEAIKLIQKGSNL